MPHFIKYLTNLRAHFIIKNRIAKNKVSISIKPIFFFFKIIIELIQIFGSQLLFKNIKIITYIIKILEGHAPHP